MVLLFFLALERVFEALFILVLGYLVKRSVDSEQRLTGF